MLQMLLLMPVAAHCQLQPQEQGHRQRLLRLQAQLAEAASPAPATVQAPVLPAHEQPLPSLLARAIPQAELFSSQRHPLHHQLREHMLLVRPASLAPQLLESLLAAQQWRRLQLQPLQVGAAKLLCLLLTRLLLTRLLLTCQLLAGQEHGP